jgi:glycerophosphoryl diester phosphodiesterase
MRRSCFFSNDRSPRQASMLVLITRTTTFTFARLVQVLTALYILSCTRDLSASDFEIVAHRGVHQNYHRQGLRNETCTATRIERPVHEFHENTLPSIEKAFEYGATMVEFDVHPTTEEDGRPDQMVVFHDWTLDCRTNASCDNGCKCDKDLQCITHDQSLNYMRTLDLGHGYTFDGGKTFPFRGRYIGMIPTLEEVLDLLYDHRDKKLLVDLKDNMPRTIETFLRIIANYPVDIRRRVYFPRGFSLDFDRRLAGLDVPEDISQNDKAKECFKQYLFSGISGYFPKACRNVNLFIPIRETMGRFFSPLDSVRFVDLLWGWPNTFIGRAHQRQSKVYPSQVDSIEEYEQFRQIPIDGLMTNRIELIGPLAKGDRLGN